MGILTDMAILAAIDKKEIVLTPFLRSRLGTNSYDVCLGRNMAIYCHYPGLDAYRLHTLELDVAEDNPVDPFSIPEEGLVLRPGRLYLGVTQEYTETWNHVPFVDGKSSIGRLGIFIHATAGRGDIGFCGHWTLEIVVVHPIRIYAGMPIGQLIFFEKTGVVGTRYDQKSTQHYNQKGFQEDPKPQPSQMFKNFSS